MIVRKRGKKIYVVKRENGREKWFGGNTLEEAIENSKQKFTVEKFCSYYIMNTTVRESTKETYKFALKSFCAMHGKKKLDELTTLDLQFWIQNIKGTDRTKKDYFNAVRTALKRAEAWELIQKQIWRGVIVPKPKKTVGKAYTEEQVKTLVEKSKNTILHLPILLGVFCGLRVSEICGLRTSRIFEKHIVVDCQLKRIKNVSKNILNVPTTGKTKIALVEPKTPCSVAKVPLPAIVSNAIQTVVRNDLFETDLLLLQENGRPFEPSFIRKQFKKFCKENNLPCLRIHDLRHTTATLLLQAGLDPLTVSNELRHSDVTTTQTIYQHLTEEMKKQPAIVFDKMFSDSGQVGKFS